MDEDDDQVPQLVDIGSQDEASDSLPRELEDINIVKVPITIVTGR